MRELKWRICSQLDEKWNKWTHMNADDAEPFAERHKILILLRTVSKIIILWDDDYCNYSASCSINSLVCQRSESVSGEYFMVRMWVCSCVCWLLRNETQNNFPLDGDFGVCVCICFSYFFHSLSRMARWEVWAARVSATLKCVFQFWVAIKVAANIISATVTNARLKSINHTR